MTPIWRAAKNRQWLRLRCGNGCGARAALAVDEDAVKNLPSAQHLRPRSPRRANATEPAAAESAG